VCVDANAGQRAAAKERAAQKDAIFAQEGLKFFNRETTLKRSQNLNILGYSRDISDARASALAQIGQGRQQVEDATRAYLTSRSVDEGGRSRRFGLKKYKQLLAKRQEVDSVIDNILGRNLAYVQEQSKRKFQVAQAQAREALGIPAAYGAPVMLPPSNRLGGALSLISNVVGIASGVANIADSDFFSDVNIKENIEEVGVSPNGHKIYEFNYKGFKDRWRGAMAQDVVKKNPMAVGILNGILTVDYSKIDVNMELV
tara:strand:+ start:181 stop:951 length:771 start_codon:yes stop_codon:yes gene_type:complete